MGQGPWPPRSQRPKFAAKVCRIQILYRAKNAKYYVQMCKKLQLLRNFVSQTPYRSLARGQHWGTSDSPASLAALNVNESLCFNLRSCFSINNDVCSAPNSLRTRNQRHGFMHDWMTLAKIVVPICLYCLKCTKFSQLILRKIIKIVAIRCQILRLICIKFHFG